MLCRIYTVFLMALSLVTAGLQDTDSDVFHSPSMCMDDLDCKSIHPYAVCAYYEQADGDTPTPEEEGFTTLGNPGGGNETEGSGSFDSEIISTQNTTSESILESSTSTADIMRRCRCNSDLDYHKDGDVCVQHIPVGVECHDDVMTLCTDPHAECVSDGTMGRNKRCLCIVDWVVVQHSGKHVCARQLTVKVDQSCFTCHSNEGTCYDVTGDDRRDGCLCPSTRSGDNCTVQHVAVHCDVDQFRMVICYNLHPNIDFSRGFGLYVTGRDDEMCKGHVVKSEDADCPDWDGKMVLGLHGDRKGRCRAKEITSIPNVRKFEKTITVAALGPIINAENSVTFNAFCQFTTNAATSFNGVNVVGVPGNDRGQFNKPALGLNIESRLGEPIPEGVALRLGDKIRFKVNLIDDGIYSAVRIEQCTASSSPVIPDPKAVVLPLTVNGCPADGQKVMTAENNWRSGGSVNTVQTGLVSMFKMRRGVSVFLHCTVKLCLKDSEEDCSPVMCTKPVGHYGYGRKRRAADTPTILTRELRWYNDSVSAVSAAQVADMSMSVGSRSMIVIEAVAFGILLTLLLILLLIFMLLSAFLFYRLRKGNFVNPPEDGDISKPQRFALPRITRNTFRI